MKLVRTALALSLLAACTTAKENPGPPPPPRVQADSRKAEVTQQSLTEATVTATVALANSDPTPAKVVGAHWELVFDGNVIAQGDQRLDVPVPANGQAEVQVSGKGTYAKDAEAVQALSEKRGGILTALRGKLSLQGQAGGTAELEFAKSTSLREPRLPRVVMQDVGASHYDDGHVNVSLSFAIDNPNPFPLQIASFNYKLDINDHTIAEQTKGAGVEVPPSSKKVFEETDELTPEKIKDLDAIYKKNALRYSVTGVLDLGLAKEEVKLEAPIYFSH